MRVLVVSASGAGHITPLVPLIDAFIDAGDEVLVMSGPEARPLVEKTSAIRAGRSQPGRGDCPPCRTYPRRTR